MSCEFCGTALSGLIAGMASLISFVVFPAMEIVVAFLGLIFEKILSFKKESVT